MSVVITHPKDGVYLGQTLGLGFWTLMDSVGQPSACVFKSVKQATKQVESWEEHHPVRDYVFVTVKTADDRYATIQELKDAGLEHLLGDMEQQALEFADVSGNA